MEKLLNRLYDPKNKYYYELNIYFKTRKGLKKFKVDLYDFNKIIDCKVGHFGYNFYFRTNKGIKKEKYSTFNHLINAIKKTSQKYDFIKYYGYEVIVKKDYFDYHKHLIKKELKN